MGKAYKRARRWGKKMRTKIAKYYPKREDLLKFLKGRILDIGCNYGEFHKLVIERGKDMGGVVYGLDIEVINYRDNMIKGDAHYLPFKDESFDSIFAGEIIEHLTNPAQFLKEIERVLKKGGVAVLTAPNPYSLTLLYLKDRFLGRSINYTPSGGFGHVYIWDISLLISLVKRTTNLKIKEFGYTEKGGEISLGIIGRILHRVLPEFLSGLIYLCLEKR